MAAFTKLALCGHRQVVVCSNATAATCILVAACAMCSQEESEGGRDVNHFARPELREVEVFADESIEIISAVETATAIPVLDEEDLLSIDEVENITIAVPSGTAMFAGFELTSLHAVLLRLKIAGVPICSMSEENGVTKVFVEVSRYCVYSALRDKVADLRFFLERQL
ncbi:hypothetical protein BH10CYA1_BH10CYA1_32470 [soil metagenome]